MVRAAVLAAVLVTVAAIAGCDGSERAAGPIAPMVEPPDPAAVRRGEYLVAAAGCVGCHTDKEHGGARLAGGRPIPSFFGTFASRNITPDPVTGIGAWSEAEFLSAIRTGISPSGEYFFPTFPFSSFTGMTDRDILDIRAYLFAQPPVRQAHHEPPRDVPFPFNLPRSMVLWRALYFSEGPVAPDPAQSAEWNRGAYLVKAVGRCGECHTPRGWLGAPNQSRRFNGAKLAGPGNKRAPNLTPDPNDGIGKWSVDDIAALLKTGITADGDVVAAPMSEIVEGTAKLTDADRKAIAVYLKSLPPLPGKGG